MSLDPGAGRQFPLLIVDDDSDVLRSLVFLVGTRGYVGQGCTSGSEALARAEADPRFFAMIIDQDLADMPGLDLLAGLRARGVRAPAILITTAPPPRVRRQAAAFGVPLVEKPLLDEALFDHLHHLTDA